VQTADSKSLLDAGMMEGRERCPPSSPGSQQGDGCDRPSVGLMCSSGLNKALVSHLRTFWRDEERSDEFNSFARRPFVFYVGITEDIEEREDKEQEVSHRVESQASGNMNFIYSRRFRISKHFT
jgi:hypothetical protein